MTTPAPDNIRVSKREVTTIAPADTSVIELRTVDWRRIYREVKAIDGSTSSREMFAGIAWGVTFAALLALIPLYQATQATDPWVKPAFWIIAGASALIGLIAYLGLKNSSKDVTAAKAQVMEDMRDIHTMYFPNSPLDPPAKIIN